MKTSVIICAVLLLAGGALAQSGGSIGLYSDNPGFSDCNLVETVGVVNSIYVVHVLMPEATSCRFRVVHNWHQATVLSTDYHTNLTSGNIYTGTTITYPGCEPLPYLVATLQLLPTAPAPPCQVYLYAVPDPAAASGQIEVVDCGGTTWFATVGGLTVNGNEVDCPCFLIGEYPLPDWVATEATTWGAVKSLYR